MKTLILFLALTSSAFADGPSGQTLSVSATEVCKSGYAHNVRNVSTAVKNAVYARDGLKQGQGVCADGCIVDHIVSLELGGNNELSNLQVQTRIDSAAKDKIENYLHNEVCAGRLHLEDAQWLIRNWRYLIR